MLKINLLPAYIYERRKVRRAAFGFGFLFIMVLAGMITWWTMLSNKQKDLQVQVTDMEMQAQQVQALEQQIQAEQASISTVRGKVEYIEAVMDYNLASVKLYDELAKYTYSRILYRSIQPSGNQLQIQAHARTLGDCGRYLLNMYRAGHLFTTVTISSVPGWSGSSPGGFDFTADCTLSQPIVAPVYGGAVGADAGMAGGMPGGPGGMPGSVPPASSSGSSDEVEDVGGIGGRAGRGGD